jgi:hypothetical protein
MCRPSSWRRRWRPWSARRCPPHTGGTGRWRRGSGRSYRCRRGSPEWRARRRKSSPGDRFGKRAPYRWRRPTWSPSWAGTGCSCWGNPRTRHSRCLRGMGSRWRGSPGRIGLGRIWLHTRRRCMQRQGGARLVWRHSPSYLCAFGQSPNGLYIARAEARLLTPTYMWRALLLASVHLVSGYWNRDYGEICNPHDHTEDGKFYCSDFYQGWWNGGAGSARISGTQCYTGVANRCWCTECADGGDTCDAYDDEKCLRKSCHDSNCQCPDCGNTWTQCIHSRCDDATEGWDADFGRCFYTEPGGNKVYREPSNKDYCYKRKVACDPSVCAGDERLTGCKRISSGACTPCPDPQPPGKFYYGGMYGLCCLSFGHGA